MPAIYTEKERKWSRWNAPYLWRLALRTIFYLYSMEYIDRDSEAFLLPRQLVNPELFFLKVFRPEIIISFFISNLSLKATL